MATTDQRKLLYERIHLRCPFNEVTFLVKIIGHLSKSDLENALKKVILLHPLLGSKVRIDEDGNAIFLNDENFNIEILEMERKSAGTIYTCLEKLTEKPFDVEVGPLVQFGIVNDGDITELVLYFHHIICDGVSVPFVIEDILNQAITEQEPENSVDLSQIPVIDNDIFVDEYKLPFLVRKLFGRLNKKWKKSPKIFSETEFQTLHAKFWTGKTKKIISHEFTPEETAKIIQKSKENEVTINSTFFSAILSATNKIFDQNNALQYKLVQAVGLRDRVKAKIERVLGLFASAYSIKYKIKPEKLFWTQTTEIHQKLKENFNPAKIYLMSMVNIIDPNLLDSIYFDYVDLFSHPASKSVSKILGMLQPTLGAALTNIRRIEIPRTYGDLRVESIIFIPPPVVNYKFIVGLWSFNGKIGYSLVYIDPLTDSSEMEKIQEEINSSVGG